LVGCQTSQRERIQKSINPNNYQEKKDWEHLYALELQSALDNEDDIAFHFFWIYYLKARHENKLEALDESNFSQ
jgi:hypothetical protein